MRRAILLLTAMGAMLLMYTGQVLATHLPPDLAISWHNGPSKASPGDEVYYSGEVENKGGRTATIPDGTVVSKHTFTGTTSTYCYAGSGYTCSGVGTETVEIVAEGEQNLGVGQSIYSSVYATAPTATGKMSHSVTADPNEVIEEIDEGNNVSDTIATYVGPPPPTDLSVAQTDNEDPVYVGDYLYYTVTVTNNGNDTAFNVVVDDAFSANATYEYASGGRSCNSIASENTVVCPLGDILSGESKELDVYVNPNAAGTITNTATAFNDNGDPEPSNDTATEETTVQPGGGDNDGPDPNPVPSTEPTITNVSPKNASKTRDRTPLISATVSDDTTNLKQAGKIQLFLDGRQVQGSYDGTADKLSYTPPKRLAYGRHTVRVVATDEDGNEAVRAWNFKIVKRR